MSQNGLSQNGFFSLADNSRSVGPGVDRARPSHGGARCIPDTYAESRERSATVAASHPAENRDTDATKAHHRGRGKASTTGYQARRGKPHGDLQASAPLQTRWAGRRPRGSRAAGEVYQSEPGQADPQRSPRQPGGLRHHGWRVRTSPASPCREKRISARPAARRLPPESPHSEAPAPLYRPTTAMQQRADRGPAQTGRAHAIQARRNG